MVVPFASTHEVCLRSIHLIWVILISSSATALPVGPGGSVTYEQIRSGTMLFPAAICPDVNKRYEDLTEKLDALKLTIRKGANCPDELATVNDFASVTAKNRAAFWEIIKKGQKQPLDVTETENLKKYIESLARSGAVVTDLVAGSSCFKDDKRNHLSLEVVTSLISESTGALATVSGPYGPLVGLGGKLAASLIGSIDTIVRSRRAYDFAEPDQRKLFVKTLCSYYGFRADLDEISRIDESIHDMTEYQLAIGQQISGLTGACPECSALAKDYNRDYKNGEDYVWWPMSQLLVKFKDRVAEANARFVLPVGSSTVIALRSWVWASDNLLRLNQNLSDLGDVERDRVIAIQDTLEDFLFAKWLPKFVLYYERELDGSLRQLDAGLYKNLDQLGEILLELFSVATEIPTYIPHIYSSDELIAKLYGPHPARSELFKDLRTYENYIQGARLETDRQLERIVSLVMTIDKNCQFASASRPMYRS